MPTGVELQLFDGATPAANLSGIQALWWDVTEPKDASRPVGKSSVVTTDASGYIHLDLSNVTGLAPTDEGFLMLYKLDGTDHRDSPMFAGKVAVSTITSGVDMYYYDSGWTRPADWLALPEVLTTDQKFVGLHRVDEENANFVALSAEGAYVINWGDGTGDQNIASGVNAETNILWANAPETSDVGIANAVACTFQDTGDTVTLNGHDFKNGEKVAFASITSTTGISTYTTYWVRDAAADTFKISATQNGSALALTIDGSGAVYRPQYRQVVVTLTMQAENNLTKLDLHVKHSQTGLQTYSSGFLDIALASEHLIDLRLGVAIPGSSTQTIRFDLLEQINIVRSNMKQCEFLFRNCYRLQNIVDIATSTDAASTSAVTFTASTNIVNHSAHGRINGESVEFSAINTTTGIVVGTRYFIINRTADTYQVASTYGGTALVLTNNGTGTAVYGTNFSNMFSGCNSLQSIPLLNTSSGTNFAGMFAFCSSLQSIPLLNTSNGTSFSSMFSGCTSLQAVPLLNTANGTSFSSMFSNCYSLQSIPLLNTANGTSFISMFSSCYSLQSIPLLNTANGTSFISMFSFCSSLQAVPLLNTANGTNFGSMFSFCSSLQAVPLLNTANGTNFGSMFNSCYSLQSIPLLNTANGTSFSSMFSGCNSLERGALSGTRYAISYASCKLSGAELNRIYENLGAPDGGARTITVTNNWGTATDNPALVPAGWTVSGS